MQYGLYQSFKNPTKSYLAPMEMSNMKISNVSISVCFSDVWIYFAKEKCVILHHTQHILSKQSKKINTI